MELNYDVLYKHFSRDEINGIAEHVLMRIDEDELDDVYGAVSQAMDDELIYTDDQWAMIREYCTPSDASFSDAWDMFENDLVNAINDGVLIREDKHIGTLEMEDGDYYDVVKKDGKLIAGASTNACFFECYSVKYDDDETLDGNLQRLYETISEAKQERRDVEELLKDY